MGRSIHRPHLSYFLSKLWQRPASSKPSQFEVQVKFQVCCCCWLCLYRQLMTPGKNQCPFVSRYRALNSGIWCPKMDGLQGKIILKWMIQWYPQLWKPPFGFRENSEETMLFLAQLIQQVYNPAVGGQIRNTWARLHLSYFLKLYICICYMYNLPGIDRIWKFQN